MAYLKFLFAFQMKCSQLTFTTSAWLTRYTGAWSCRARGSGADSTEVTGVRRVHITARLPLTSNHWEKLVIIW